MGKLWDKGYSLNAEVEAFSVGDDPQLDTALIAWDCAGSAARGMRGRAMAPKSR